MFPFRGRGGFPGFPMGPRFPMGGGMGPGGGMQNNMMGGFTDFSAFNGPAGMRQFMPNNVGMGFGGRGSPHSRGGRGAGGRGGRGMGRDAGPSRQQNSVKNESAAVKPSTSSNSDKPSASPATQVEIKSEAQSESVVPAAKRAPPLPGEDEPEFDEALCILDWYNSDLNLKINPTDFCSAQAMSKDGFGYMWGGARASYGVTRGRSCFEVKVEANQPTDHLEGEETPNVLRVGWSISGSNLQLGEVQHSFGYGGTGKAAENCVFKNYGSRFGVGDILGCYLDMSSENCLIKFTLNGRDQGVAFRFQKKALEGKALFPHVLTKNQDFSVNFGQLPGPLKPLLPGFTPIGQLELTDGLVRGPQAPASRGDCEVLMMIGLPGAGKTYWAEKFAKENADKNYNILGTNNLIEKMKVNGLSRKRNYHGRWEILIKKCTQCFNTILDLAAKRRRNYILDQTNVFPTARGRKLKDFKGFTAKAVVVVPADEEFRRRVAEREAVEGKEIPDNAVLNMKSNFVLPELEETFFKDVWYTELGPAEAHKIINSYNEEARSGGLTIMQGVRSFKIRNENKRNDQKIPLPGKKVKFDKSMKVIDANKSSEDKVQASTSSVSSQEIKTEPKIEPKTEPRAGQDSSGSTRAGKDGPGTTRTEELKRENRNQASGRGSSKDKHGRTDSKDRRRSRSRDRKRSLSRDRSRSERGKRSRSSDRRFDHRDRGRKRSRSRSRERSNQRSKEDVKPWSRDSGRGPSSRASSSATDRHSSLNRKPEPFNKDRSESTFNNRVSEGNNSGRGRGRGWGRGGLDGGRGGFDGRRGGFESGRSGFEGDRGGFDGGRSGVDGGRGGFDSGRGGFESGRGGFIGGRGGFEGGRGGFEGGRGGFDGGRSGRFDGSHEGGRGGQEEGRRFTGDQWDQGGRQEAFGEGPASRGGVFPRDRSEGGQHGPRRSHDGEWSGPGPRSQAQREAELEPAGPGSRRGAIGLLGDPPQRENRFGSQSGYMDRNDRLSTGNYRDAGPRHDQDQQTGDNEFYNNKGNFSGNESWRNDGPARPANEDRYDRRPGGGGEGPRNQDYGYSDGFDSRGRFDDDARNQFKETNYENSHFGQKGSTNAGLDNAMGGGGGGSSGVSASGPKIRDLDDEFAMRMEKRLEAYDDEPTHQDNWQERGGDNRDSWRPNDMGGAYYHNDRDLKPAGLSQHGRVAHSSWNTRQDLDGGRSDDRYGQQSTSSRPTAGFREDSYNYSRNDDTEYNAFGSRQDGYDLGSQAGHGKVDQAGRHPLSMSGEDFGNRNGATTGNGGGGRFEGREGIDHRHRSSPPRRAPPGWGQDKPGWNDQARSFEHENTRGQRFREEGPGGSQSLEKSDRSDIRPPPPKIPNWDTPAPQANTSARDSRFPITSDGRNIDMGYSVQYHSESFERPLSGQGGSRVKQAEEAPSSGFNARGGQDRLNFRATADERRTTKEESQSSRLNLDHGSIPGMNPPAPDASSSSSGGNHQSASSSGPDYAALLQYLQFYQKQMGTDETRK